MNSLLFETLYDGISLERCPTKKSHASEVSYARHCVRQDSVGSRFMDRPHYYLSTFGLMEKRFGESITGRGTYLRLCPSYSVLFLFHFSGIHSRKLTVSDLCDNVNKN